jgi:hypothetical protein
MRKYGMLAAGAIALMAWALPAQADWPEGANDHYGGNAQGDVEQGSPIVRGTVPLANPPKGCEGCYNDRGGLQDGGSSGDHRSDNDAANN